MSTEPEDALERALRADLPSPDTEARLRRRLLAAGVAVGNGIATTTAAASGASTGVATGGILAKVAGLSWGVKVGLAAAVAIPSVGLLLEPHAPTRTTAQTPVAVATEPAAVAPTRASEVAVTPVPATEPAEPVVEKEDGPRSTPAPRALRPVVEAAAPAANTAPAAATGPSQGDFAAVEAPARAAQTPSSLGEETRLLDAAFAALAAGDRARAATLIAEHEARYPRGLLSKERLRAKTRLSELSRGD